jgi:putative membrane-bound dehydrogenase-like protein
VTVEGKSVPTVRVTVPPVQGNNRVTVQLTKGLFGGVANVSFQPAAQKKAAEKQPTKTRAKRVAFVAGVRSHNYGAHEHKAGSILLARKLKEAMPNIETVVHVNGWPKNPEALDGFDCIVMYCDGGGRHMVNPHLAHVDRYAKQGVGIVCIHYGVEVPKGDSGNAFLNWIGGYFEANWSVNPHWDASFKTFPKHPICNGVKPFATNDEWYYHMRFREGMKNVTPILTDLPPASTLVRPDGSLARPDNAHNNNPHVREAVLKRKERQHVAWAATREDGGRGFGFTGGHNHWNWGNPNQLKVVLNAITWCAKAEVPSEGVAASEVTLDELLKNQDYDPKPNYDFAKVVANLDKWNGRETLPLVPAGEPLKPVAVTPSPKPTGALFQSKVVRKTAKGQSVDINVELKGAKKLYLVVTDGGDGFSCDWADWVNPRFVGPKGETSLTKLKWKTATAGFGEVRVNGNAGGGKPSVGGKPVEACIGTHSNSVIEYDVPAGATHFKAVGALDDAGVKQGCGSTVTFAVYSTKPARLAAGPIAAGAGSHDLKDALSQLDVAKGLEASIFAAEPLMSNPVNMDIDHLGRVWIVEVVNYRRFRNKDYPERKEGDRILILEDTDKDGVADKTQVFYQGKELNKGHGLCLLPGLDGKSWRVIVSCADQIFSLYDDDGDLKADRKEPLFTGTPGTDHDHGLHAFVFGPDGKLYFNFGNSGKQLLDKNGKPVVDLAGNVVNDKRKPYQEGMVFRCDLDGNNVETVGWNFRNNWEISVDSFGTLWQSDNDDDGNRGTRINFVMEFGNYGYKDELTGAGWKTPRTNLEKSIPLQHWHLNDPGVIPNLVQTGQGSPTGILVYEGDMLPSPFRNNTIHCDAGPNIVRAYPARKSGAGYKAYTQNVLFGARDNWFRPSDVCVAPDGSIIIADWYDPGVGGHRMQDVNRGRLFRVAVPGSKYSVPKVDVSTIEGAIEALKSPNLVTRYLAWTKLNGEGAKAEPALKALFEKSKNPRVQARALWLLGKIDGKGAEYVDMATSNFNEDLRIVGLRLARQLKMDLIPIVQKLAGDPSPSVRRECAIALRFIHSSDKAKAWAQLAAQHDGKDRWYLESLGIGAGKDWDICLAAFFDMKDSRISEAAARDILWRSRSKETPELLGRVIASERTSTVETGRYFRAFDFLQGAEKNSVLFELAFGYTGHGDADKVKFVNSEAIKRLGSFNIKSDTKALAALNRMLDRVKGTSQFVQLVTKFKVADRYPGLLEIAVKNADKQVGVDAIVALFAEKQWQLISSSLNSKNEEVALATVQVMALSGDGRGASLLLRIVQDDSLSSVLRRQSAQAAAISLTGALKLIELAKKDELDAALVPAVASKLHSSSDKGVRDQAAKLFPLPPVKGSKPLPPVAQLVAKKGDVARGKIVFDTTGTCAKCHKVDGKGKDVGPDLSGIGLKLSRTAFYESILFPSAGISHNYETYSAILNDGNTFSGLKISETDDSVTLKNTESIVRKIPKSDVDEIVKQPISIMPADLQKLVTEKDLVDVVEYLTTLKKAQAQPAR